MENILNMHAHITKESVDCDGPFYQEYVSFLTHEEKAKSRAANGVNDFTDIEFRRRILGDTVSVYAIEYGLTMKAGPNGFNWCESTDEGHRGGEVRWCDDESCTPAYSQRDVYAEIMGY